MISREQDRLQAISENLANCNAPGFKKLDVGQLDFDTLLHQSIDEYNELIERGTYDPISIDFSNGPIKLTERSLDFAIDGEGFFAVKHDKKEVYTRNGHFKVAPNGLLQNMDGMPVQGSNGNITIPAETNITKIITGSDGTIRDQNNNLLGTLKIVGFEDVSKLGRLGTTLYGTTEDRPARILNPGDYQIVPKSLEGSNTSIYNEMAEMISTMRSYETNQRILKAHDENQGRMIVALG